MTTQDIISEDTFTTAETAAAQAEAPHAEAAATVDVAATKTAEAVVTMDAATAVTKPYSKPMSEKKQQIIDSFLPFGLGSLLYGIFFCFCLYRNFYGITFPFLCAGTLLYYFSCFRALGVTAPKGKTVFFSAAILLLGLSNVLTTSWVLIFFNYIGIILLIFCFVLQFFYDTRKWDFSKHMAELIRTMVCCLGNLPYPFRSLHRFLKERQSEKSRRIYQVLIGLLISVPLLLVIGGLLAGADAVFRHFTDKLLADLFAEINFGNIILMIFLTLIGIIGSFCILTELAGESIRTEVPDKRTMDPLIAITFTSVLTVIYLAFCLIQILYLFTGSMALPENYTYAQYAREGFFQLLFVCLINLGLVLFCKKHYRDNRVLKGILTIICGCTYIMIASSTMRMLLYIGTYHLTFTRVFVLLALLVLAICLAGVVISIYRDRFPLFGFMLAVVTVSYVLFSLSRPDTYIAYYNIHYTKNVDFWYLYNLSYDALPVMEKAGLFEKEKVRIPQDFTRKKAAEDTDYWDNGYWDGDLRAYALHVQDTYNKMSLRKFNLSVYLAEEALEDYLE